MRRPAIARRVLLLDEDPDLGSGLPAADFDDARRALSAAVVSAERGSWRPPEMDPGTGYGLLVLDGLLGRRLRLGSAVATELLGSGDILRPWEEPSVWGMVPPELDWRVLDPVRLAVLDERITRLIGRRPELVVNFSGRLLRRTRSVAYLLAVSHRPRVQEKLILTLWHLASNWGRVGPDGVTIPVRVTHQTLGEIIGAQRPSVTTALRALQDRGDLRRAPGGFYVLLTAPPDLRSPAPRPVAVASASTAPA